MEKKRCTWAENDPLSRKYHDEEWCVPTHDDRVHFEFLVLEAMQCGLSWITVLRKRAAMEKAFDGFDYKKIAHYDEAKILELLENPEIIRSRRKIEGMISNARLFLEIQEQEGSFDHYLWSFVDGKVQKYPPEERSQPSNALSETISKDLKKRGFKFMGSVVVYSFLQAVGVIDDHEEQCFKCSCFSGN